MSTVTMAVVIGLVFVATAVTFYLFGFSHGIDDEQAKTSRELLERRLNEHL